MGENLTRAEHMPRAGIFFEDPSAIMGIADFNDESPADIHPAVEELQYEQGHWRFPSQALCGEDIPL